ncbi:unnamed protein product, partial [Ascophyllum nodosum]
MTTCLLFVFAALASTAAAIEYTLAPCADLSAVDDTVATYLVITASPFSCDEYTRFRVRNGMTLTATVSGVVFSNFSRQVVGGDLTVEPDVVFNDVFEQ